jgi:hypothetical protein
MRWLVVAALLAGCSDDERARKLDEQWKGAVLVKVCRDGTYVYRLSDGKHRTGGLAAAYVDNPETVCQ